MTKILFFIGVILGLVPTEWWAEDSQSKKKGAMSKTVPALNGALEHQVSFCKGVFPD